MFRTLQLRFVVMMLVVLSQAILSLLSVANIIAADLKGSLAMLPIFIAATNAPLSLAILAVVILDYAQRSPLSVLSEIVFCAAAGGIDFISAIAVLLFKMSGAICGVRPSNDFWNTCGAQFAVAALLWTTTFLLFTYTIVLFYAAKRYDALHPLGKESVWRQTVKETRWPRQTYSVDNPPGRRLRKRAPLDVESLRRVVQDRESSTFGRQMSYGSSSSLPATPLRSAVRPPGLDSPSAVGFSGRMGYLRRDAQGEYVPSTPALRGPLPGSSYRGPPEGVRHGTVPGIQAMTSHRRPSFPDLPNPFPPQPAPNNPTLSIQQTAIQVSRSRAYSNSSGNSSGSDSGFAGIGAGLAPQKDALRVSIPMPLLPRNASPPSARSAKAPVSGVPLGEGYQRPFRVSAPSTPTSALPRLSLQSSLSPVTPSLPQIRQAGARPGYSFTHQHARSRSSLAATVTTAPARAVVHEPNPLLSQTRPRAGSASSQTILIRPALQVPPAAMSPSTKQRASNTAYPLPLPPLSTYPIKSVAMSAGSSAQASQVHPPPELTSSIDSSARRDAQTGGQSMKDRPLSVVSTVSCYSTSSASHGPQPSREHLSAASASLFSVSTESGDAKGLTVKRSDSTSSRRSLKSKKPPALARAPSHHGTVSQNFWGGTGNGPARRSLASQFQQPQVHPTP